ncbi:MAG: methionyl-tRNA formyltransferase [Bacilli bacterium]
MKNKRVLFMGTPIFAVPTLENLIKNCNVIGVVSQPDKIVGRKKILEETPIKTCALNHNIKVIQPVKIKDSYEEIKTLNPDIIITCAYGQFVPKKILDIPKFGCINVHGSLLPSLRGGAPIHKAIISGLKETGITIMYMDPKMDSGNIIAQSSIPILESDTYSSLHDKLSILGSEFLIKTLPSIFNGTNESIEQNIKKVTFGYNVTREEEHIDFNKTMEEVYNHIRGLNPTPLSYFIFDDMEFKAIECKKCDEKQENSKNGQIVKVFKKGIGVKVSDGVVIITKIKPFGKKIMDTSSFINGYGREKLIDKLLK